MMMMMIIIRMVIMMMMTGEQVPPQRDQPGAEHLLQHFLGPPDHHRLLGLPQQPHQLTG
jgi:hypothetical protein